MMNKKLLVKILINGAEVMNANDFDEYEIVRMDGYNQNNPHHVYDLWGHTKNTVIQVLKSDFYSDNLAIAALLHDIGKPDCAIIKNNITVFYGHAQKSKEIAEKLLTKWGFCKEDIDEICFYISHHDDFINFKYSNEIISKSKAARYFTEINATNVYKYFEETCKSDIGLFVSLIALCIADASSQADIAVCKNYTITKKQKIDKLIDIYNFICHN